MHSLNLTSSAEENEDIMIAQMFIESLIGQWIMFDTQAQEGIRPLGEAGFGSQEEIVQKILALLTDAELFTIGREISPGIFSISLNKEMVKQIVEVAGKTVDATDLSEINVQGTINNDLANPVVSIGRSHLDATTIIRARRTKERFVLNMTDRLIGLDSTMTFAKKLNGIGFSYKDSSKTTVDVSYFLNNLISTMRATIVIEDDTMIRMNMK